MIVIIILHLYYFSCNPEVEFSTIKLIATEKLTGHHQILLKTVRSQLLQAHIVHMVM